MSLNAASKEKPVQNFLTPLIEACPDASMRDIAVLFTDVVGSTTFFKTHGDIRERAMLRTHHHMAMLIVEDYGGSLAGHLDRNCPLFTRHAIPCRCKSHKTVSLPVISCYNESPWTQ